MDITIRTTATVADINAFLTSLPAVLSGAAPDRFSVAPVGLRHAVQKMMGLVKDDYHTKSVGQVGEDGQKWEPLRPMTIEHRRKKAAGGHTSTAQAVLRAEWTRRFRNTGLPKQVAQQLAAAKVQQWAAAGDMPILIDEAVLIGACSPGVLTGKSVDTEYTPPERGERLEDQHWAEQVIDERPGMVEIRIESDYADEHMTGVDPDDAAGVPGMPARPFVPADDVPQDWTDQCAEAYAAGLQEALADVLANML